MEIICLLQIDKYPLAYKQKSETWSSSENVENKKKMLI